MVPLGAQPSLMVFVRLDPNAGSLLVTANQDDATVYLNNYEYWRKTKDGQLKIANLPVGPITIRLAKWLYDVEPFSVKTEIRKGEELHLDFKLFTFCKISDNPNNSVNASLIITEGRKPSPEVSYFICSGNVKTDLI